jgi:HEAT repeat protein
MGSIEQLLEELRFGTPRIQSDAAIALGETGDPRVVDPLISALGEEDSDLRLSASLALGRIGSPAIEPLMSVFMDGNEMVCRLAAGVLKQIGDVARESVIAALEERVPDLCIPAAIALGYLADQRSIPALITALDDPDEDLSEAVSDSLTAFGTAAIGPLNHILRNGNAALRLKAVTILGDIDDPQAVYSLILALKDADDTIVGSALCSLAERGRSVAEPLIEAVQDEGQRCRNVIEALGRTGDPRAVDLILRMLETEAGDLNLRMGAIFGLGILGDVRAVEPLLHALTDEYCIIRSIAAWGLGELHDERAVDGLIRALRDPEVGPVAAASLGKIGCKRAVQPLIQMLGMEHVNSVAHSMISAYGDTLGFDRFLEIQETDDGQFIRSPAAWALGELGDPQAVDPLIRALRGPDSDLSREAALALGKLGDPACVEPLKQASEDKRNPALQSEAITALEMVRNGISGRSMMNTGMAKDDLIQRT